MKILINDVMWLSSDFPDEGREFKRVLKHKLDKIAIFQL
jgi:hypothetical protein